ncbi:MAG: hypothetical protein ABFC34_13695 [Methanobacterium sp.]
MAGFGRGAAILISIMVGLIILPLLGIKGLFAIVIIGFIANYLTVNNQRGYLIGAIAGGAIGLIVFICGFFVSPVLPDLPTLSSSKMIKLELWGLSTLLIGFFVLIVTCTGLGAIGGAIVQKIFTKKSETEKYKKRDKPQRNFNKYLKLILNRNKHPKNFNNRSGKTLGRNKRQKSFNNKPRRSLKKK